MRIKAGGAIGFHVNPRRVCMELAGGAVLLPPHTQVYVEKYRLYREGQIDRSIARKFRDP